MADPLGGLKPLHMQGTAATWEEELLATVRERDVLRAEVERLRAELARWKPSQCGKIYPVPTRGEVVKHCAREYDHDGPHQAETGEIWVFDSNGPDDHEERCYLAGYGGMHIADEALEP